MADAVPGLPRPSHIGIMGNGDQVAMSPYFARWLDQFVRQTNTVTVTANSITATRLASYPERSRLTSFADYPAGTQQAPRLAHYGARGGSRILARY